MHSDQLLLRPSAPLTWLAVSRLSQRCASHTKQDVGLDPLGEFTSSPLLKQAAPSAVGGGRVGEGRGGAPGGGRAGGQALWK